MRKEPFTVGNYVHVLNRGAKKMPITRGARDQWRFLKILCHLNDSFISEHWEDELDKNVEAGASLFDRPPTWKEKEPLVAILAYTLMPNHFHLVLKEIIEGGTGRFMQKLGNSMTGHFNLKYKESGSLFQGSYKAKRIEEDKYFRYLAVYVMVKNVFELYPGGLNRARVEFNDAYVWASRYHFSSFTDYSSAQVRPAHALLDKNLMGEVFATPTEFKSFARDFIVGEKFENVIVQRVSLEGMSPAQVRPARVARVGKINFV